MQSCNAWWARDLASQNLPWLHQRIADACMHATETPTGNPPTLHTALDLSQKARNPSPESSPARVYKNGANGVELWKGMWKLLPRAASFFLAATLPLIPLLSHISKSIILIINSYPDGFYSKELDWKDNERKTDAGRWKKLVKWTEAHE